MLLATVSCAVLTVAADGGRVEVEGLVVTAVARPSAFKMHRPGGGVEIEIELSVETKADGAMPICQFVGPIKAIGADNRSLSSPSRIGFDTEPRSAGPNRWSMRLNFEEPPSKTLHALEGTLSIATSSWRTITFEGANLKPNAVVTTDGGMVKLTVLDFDDGPPDVRFRVRPAPLNGMRSVSGRAKLIDFEAKTTTLGSHGSGYASNGKTAEYSFRFIGDVPMSLRSIRKVQLEAPTPVGAPKKVAFRIPEIPLEGARSKEKKQ
jgi:hypothetical protein